ncbi:MAG: hypothetical protein HW416_1104 [Chloroflexi bacterium]|nr:hypothetical protein [Chloroflexota bacterium]
MMQISSKNPTLTIVTLVALLWSTLGSAYPPGSAASPAEVHAAQVVDAGTTDFIRSARPSVTQPADDELIVLALNALDVRPSMVAYVGRPAEKPFRLPRGDWWLYVLGSDGTVRQASRPMVLGSTTAVTVPAALVPVPGDASAAMAVLVHLALSANLATLAPISIVTDARAAGAVSRDQIVALDGLTGALISRHDAVMAAVDVLAGTPIAESEAEDTLVAASADLLQVTPSGVWGKIKKTFLNFFTSDAMTGATARRDIEAITQGYSPEQRQELFDIARENQPIQAADADEFFQGLRDGTYDSMARQLHQAFIGNHENYLLDAQSGNLRPLDTAARDGVVIVKDGAEFYADVIKTVLGARFGSDFEKGWDLAQKISDKMSDIEKAIKDPQGYLKDWAIDTISGKAEEVEGQIKDKLKDRILDDLKNMGLSPADAERLAGELADRVADGAKDKIKEAAGVLAGQAGERGTATAGGGGPGTGVASPQPTTDPAADTGTTAGQPSATPTPAETPTPTATVTRTATATFTATTTTSRPITVIISPASGPQGTTFNMTANGFGSREGVQVVLIYPNGSSPSSLTADSQGGLAGALTTGSTDPTGTYTVNLVGASGAQGSASFTVTGGATATPTATTAPTVVLASATPTEPYSVMTSGSFVFVDQKTALENTRSCTLFGWGIDCSKKVKDVATLATKLGPFPTFSQAKAAYCAAMVPGSAYYVQIANGTKAKFSFDSANEYWIDNAPGC